MRTLARSVWLARSVLLVAALGLGLTACGGGSSSSSTATTKATSTTAAPASSTSSSAPATGPGPSDQAAARAAITNSWQTFFNGSSGVATKVSLLQNGGQFRSAIQAGSNNPLASSTMAKVTNITFASSKRANVTYDIASGGKVLLPNQTGMAVLSDGKWLVSDSAFCGLLGLQGGQLPAGCPRG